MRQTGAIAALLAAGGLTAAAAAQVTNASFATFSLTWTESDPNGLPAGNGDGILEPGERALLHLTASFTNLNHTGTYSPSPPGPGSGTIRGFGGGFIDLDGTSNNGGNAQGSWNVDAATYPGQVGTNPAWDLVQNSSGWGTPINSGAHLLYLQMGQFPLNNAAIVDTNPIIDIWKGVWTPTSFQSRTVAFQSQSTGISEGWAAAIIFQTSVGPVGAGLNLNHIIFGSANIPIAPSPASCLLLAPLLFAGRHRTHIRTHP